MSARPMLPEAPPAGHDSRQAACRGQDPELFFSEHPPDVAAAKAICRDCPIRDDCLDGALNAARSGRLDLYGIWGGATPAERERRLMLRPECGTNDGFERHLQLGEWTCPACRRARHAWNNRKPGRRAAHEAARQRRREARRVPGAVA